MSTYKLPFKHASARAIIVRRKDGALLGVLNNTDHKYEAPGEPIAAGDTAVEALFRFFEERHFLMVDSDVRWENRLSVDSSQNANQLDMYYIFLVEDVRVGGSTEMLEVRWLDQTQDVWRPLLREKILLAIKEYFPELLTVDVSVLESW
jgi:hypothetical protein